MLTPYGIFAPLGSTGELAVPDGHNLNVTAPTMLTLSAVAPAPGADRPPTPLAEGPAAYGRPSRPSGDHEHSRRLCAVCVERRYLELRRAPRARIAAELVADRIRAARGAVWPAVLELGIGYRHALAIRAGWRGAGRYVEPIGALDA